MAFVSRNERITLGLAWAILAGIFIFPEYSKLTHQTGSGLMSTALYHFGRHLSDLLPDRTKVLWVGIPDQGLSDRPSCSGIVGRKCVYSKNLNRDIIFTKASHIISNKELGKNDVPDDLDIHLLKSLPLYILPMKKDDIPANYLSADISLANSLPALIQFNFPIYIYALKYHD